MDAEVVERHLDTVRALSKPGRALATDAATATVKNPAWWAAGSPTPERDALHRELLGEARVAAPAVEQGRVAVVLAGPPGAGKSTVLHELLGDEREKYLVVDADEFKRALLERAHRDGSYEGWLVPDEVRELEAAGERFYPLELASLVHEESSYLAGALRDDAMRSGDNLVIDTVLSSEESALAMGRRLVAAGYDVRVVDVEVPYAVSEMRIRGRWREAYTAAVDRGDELGGRWVPSDYARAVFDGPGGKSRPEAAALRLAQECPAVSRYRLFRTSVEQAREARATPVLEVERSRAMWGGPLVDAVVAQTMRRAAATRARGQRPGGLER